VKCSAVKANGDPCQADALPGDEGRCWFHSEKHKAERLEASAKGGSHRKVLDDSEASFDIRSAEDAQKILVQTMKQIATGKIDLSVGKTILSGLESWRNFFELTELEARLEKLEEAARQQGGI